MKGLLDEAGITLDNLDRVTPPEISGLVDGMTVTVVRVTQSEMVSDSYPLEKHWRRRVSDEDKVEEGDVLASLDADNQILAKNGGRVRIEDRTIIVSYEVKEEKYYEIPSNAHLAVDDGEIV